MGRKKANETPEYEVADGISIVKAEIKDDFCNYDYEVTEGKATGFTHGVKGKGVIDDDMRTAFSKLAVHLAVIDDMYKHSGKTIEDIDQHHSDELATLYSVTGFKIVGGEDSEAIILIGNKYLSGGSRMKLESPKTSIDASSSYKWWNELKTAADKCREEVSMYHNGKYTIEEVEEEEEVLKQTKMTFTMGDGAPDDFENE
jgi:hypothetical protein